MSFKENLLTKIKIDHLFNQVKATLGPADSERRLDTQRMRELLALSPFKRDTVRDIELYHASSPAGQESILVLDNELAFYKTSVSDIAMRKSPTLREMLNIRNAIRILNDGDVVISRKEKSLETVRKMSIEALDLTCTAADLKDMAGQGIDALRQRSSEGVIECLTLFAELTGYKGPPKPFDLADCFIRGQLEPGPSGAWRFGPLVVYDPAGHTLKMMERKLDSRDEDDLTAMRQMAQGLEAPARQGTEVISWIAETAAHILKV